MKYPVFFSILIIAAFGKRGFASDEKMHFYVSTLGNDSNIGTFEYPFASLRAAQNAIRSFRIKGFDAPVEVIIRDRVYYLDETLELTPED
jgi:hypothetical protein